jgi:hypothetical protein
MNTMRADAQNHAIDAINDRQFLCSEGMMHFTACFALVVIANCLGHDVANHIDEFVEIMRSEAKTASKEKLTTSSH